MIHVPVMVEEVMKYLDVKVGGTYVDGTAGAGGHLQKIIERAGERGKVIAIDQNKAAVEHLKKEFETSLRGSAKHSRSDAQHEIASSQSLPRNDNDGVVTVVRGNYKFIEKIVQKYVKEKVVIANERERSVAISNNDHRQNEIAPLDRHQARQASQSIAMTNSEGFVDGILLDLGFSSDEIQEEGRGFSFYDTESLDMRYGQGEQDEYLEPGMTAEEVVNTYPESDLADIFWKYGDETRSRFFAKKIVEYRRKKRIESAAELAYVIGNARPTFERFQALMAQSQSAPPAPSDFFQTTQEDSSCLQRSQAQKVRDRHAHRASPGESRRDIGIPRGKIHPATKTFMGLRIFVNKEFENVQSGLEGALRVLKVGGRCVILTFHSGEDRIVKTFIKEKKKEGTIEELTKHVVKPSREEVLKNRPSRSAKLRAFEKV